jgi:hypothetical protein
MGGAYTDADDPAQVRERYIMAVENYHLPLAERAEARVAGGEQAWATDAAQHRKRIEEAKIHGPGKYTANQSVGVYFSELPTDEQIAFMKARAEEYASRNSLTITGYRLVEYKMTVSEREV